MTDRAAHPNHDERSSYTPSTIDSSHRPEVETPAAEARLYSIPQVTLASLFGFPIAGAILLANNAQALHRRTSGRKIIFHGAVASLVLIVCWYRFSMPFVAPALQLFYAMAMFHTAKKGYGTAIQQHLAAGGSLKAHWRVLAVVLLSLCGVLATAFVFVSVLVGLLFTFLGSA